METITNVANSAASVASRAIWGDANPNTTQASESGTEPLSGQTGDVSKGQPYDAGNAGSMYFNLLLSPMHGEGLTLA